MDWAYITVVESRHVHCQLNGLKSESIYAAEVQIQCHKVESMVNRLCGVECYLYAGSWDGRNSTANRS